LGENFVLSKNKEKGRNLMIISNNCKNSRLNTHFALCAAALATGVAVGNANATVVYSEVINLAVPTTTDGVYMNVQTGAWSSTTTTPAGWDVNPYGTSTTVVSLFAATGTGYMRNPNAGTATAATRLNAGTVVGPSSFFYGNSSATMGSGTGQWAANSSGYFGFKFIAADAATHYGWMQLSIGADAGTRSIVQYAWENVANTSITVPSPVPAPGAMALLGLVGFAKRRRRS
jgi:MYXO-CTERM domain-containing protein